ncbi:phosphodiester glycosidase family protein [Bacteroides sp. BFG-637]|uniref:phosphodiester glycosidase family protein n=1 Tax=Bacteroides sp. BFG-637 TaxID=2972764 RepID=UPI0021655576|nr:phosphodiester glycosidase family protein [Bacteroides sp. BFG-637]MCS3313502.1 phosphodiester glycosidase family protein [Bacteroides sp. BFG-637]
MGIGAGPILIKDGTIRNSWVEELLDVASGINPQTCQPRSAVGITQDGKLILFVCEGREQTPDISGMTPAQLARLMKSFGCVDALNLDGGVRAVC